MKTITNMICTALAGLALTCVGLSPMAQAQLELPPPNAHLFASINGPTFNGFDQNSVGPIYQYTPPGVQSTYWGGLSRPRGLAFDSVDNFFVATTYFGAVSAQAKILKFSRGVPTTFATFENFYVEGVAIDGADNIFVVAIDINDPNLASTIFKITPDGTQSIFGLVPGQSFGLAFDSAGNLFVADAVDIAIYKFTPDGTRTIFVDSSAFGPDDGPVGLAFDEFGNLFVSTERDFVTFGGEGLILKFAPDGTGTTFADVHNYARGLAFDSDGNLFVAEVGIPGPGDILKFAPDGTHTIFASNIFNRNGGPEFLTFHLPIPPSRFRPPPTPLPRP